MHRGGIGMLCDIRPHSFSIFDKSSFLFIWSSLVFSISLIVDLCALGCWVFSSCDNLCISMISSFKTHSRGLPGFFICFIFEITRPPILGTGASNWCGVCAHRAFRVVYVVAPEASHGTCAGEYWGVGCIYYKVCSSVSRIRTRCASAILVHEATYCVWRKERIEENSFWNIVDVAVSRLVSISV